MVTDIYSLITLKNFQYYFKKLLSYFILHSVNGNLRLNIFTAHEHYRINTYQINSTFS